MKSCYTKRIARTAVMLLVLLAMLLSMTACGGGGETDPNAGMYEGTTATALGLTMAMSDIYAGETWIELNSGGRGTIALDGEEFKIKWALNGEEITISVSGEDSVGTLIDNVISIDFMNMGCLMTFERTEAPAPAADTASEKGGSKLFCSHEWQEATCLQPKTCTKCGKTSGDVVDHSFGEANHQAPATCTVCGETTGEKLPADFETYDLCHFMEIGQTYDYTTICYRNHDVETVGQIQVVSYDIVESAEGFEPMDGYEWRIVKMEVLYSDSNANKYGISPGGCLEDYYNIELLDDNNYYNEETDYEHYPILYNGEEYEVRYYSYNSWGKWKNRKNTESIVCAAHVPIGYDGVVVGRYNDSVVYDGKHIYDLYTPEDFCLFRMY